MITTDSSENRPSPAEAAFVGFLYLFRGITARFLISLLPVKWRVRLTELYHLIVLIGLLILTNRIDYVPKAIVLGLLVYLVNEQVIWSIFDILIESANRRLQGRRNPLRSVMWVLYSGIVLCWMFALYFYSSGEIGTTIAGRFNEIDSVRDAIYYSISNLMSLGSVVYVVREGADITKDFVLLEPLVGLGILLFYLAVLVSGLANVFARSILQENAIQDEERPNVIVDEKGEGQLGGGELSPILLLLIFAGILLLFFENRKKR